VRVRPGTRSRRGQRPLTVQVALFRGLFAEFLLARRGRLLRAVVFCACRLLRRCRFLRVVVSGRGRLLARRRPCGRALPVAPSVRCRRRPILSNRSRTGRRRSVRRPLDVRKRQAAFGIDYALDLSNRRPHCARATRPHRSLRSRGRKTLSGRSLRSVSSPGFHGLHVALMLRNTHPAARETRGCRLSRIFGPGGPKGRRLPCRADLGGPEADGKRGSCRSHPICIHNPVPLPVPDRNDGAGAFIAWYTLAARGRRSALRSGRPFWAKIFAVNFAVGW